MTLLNLTTDGVIEMEALLDNFQDFIARVGFRILQVPDTPQEYVGQHLLYAYLDHFVSIVGANMFLEVQTGRGRIDLLIVHNQRKYIVRQRSGKATDIIRRARSNSLRISNRHYVVFDHRITVCNRISSKQPSSEGVR